MDMVAGVVGRSEAEKGCTEEVEALIRVGVTWTEQGVMATTPMCGAAYNREVVAAARGCDMNKAANDGGPRGKRCRMVKGPVTRDGRAEQACSARRARG